MSEAENRVRSLLEEGWVDEMGSTLAEPLCGRLLEDFGPVVDIVQLDEVYQKVRGLGEEEWDGLRERGII